MTYEVLSQRHYTRDKANVNNRMKANYFFVNLQEDLSTPWIYSSRKKKENVSRSILELNDRLK